MFPLKDNIPTDRFPVLTVAIIVVNVLAYLLFQKAIGSGLLNSPDEANLLRGGAYPYELTHPGEQCELVGEEVQDDDSDREEREAIRGDVVLEGEHGSEAVRTARNGTARTLSLWRLATAAGWSEPS